MKNNNLFLNNQQIIVEITIEIRKYFEINTTENMTYQNACEENEAISEGNAQH